MPSGGLMATNVLLRDEGPIVRVRVQSGFVVRAFDDLAPTVPVLFTEYDEIPNLAASEAEELIALGAVEVIYGEC